MRLNDSRHLKGDDAAERDAPRKAVRCGERTGKSLGVSGHGFVGVRLDPIDDGTIREQRQESLEDAIVGRHAG